jgi:hypothetical protein
MRPRSLNRTFAVLLSVLALTAPGRAQDRQFALDADPVLVEAGLIRHLVPRFSMKTNTRVVLDAGGARLSPEAAEGARAVIASGTTTWFLVLPEGDPDAARFADWLTSDVGQRTIAGFVPEAHAPFTAPAPAAPVARQIDTDRDMTEGIGLSLVHCGRCHVIGPQNRHNGIGSTPSFSVLRALPRWQERFETFYVLNPHPAFTQIDAVTAPFDPARPSPIHPVEMTLAELDEILAYVASMAPAALGAPLRHQ